MNAFQLRRYEPERFHTELQIRTFNTISC